MSTIEENKALISRFPFLLPRNCFTDEVVKGYDYSFTELDNMPDGWRKAFGEQMCQEIYDDLVAADLLDKYRILQIKEKYGALRWYGNLYTDKMIHEILPHYETLSMHTCIRCGATATRMTMGWISPYCDEHDPGGSVSFDEYFKFINDV